ncbi:PKD domain-containing protein [Conexibacter sp. JD483]|uniref:PKD domain-containing protein n=1 Tax=unclassified Conexibacter TaxID=2627773 RepID=UPI00271C9F7F|nr:MULTISPECIES: PKD domain-containing protein [unclassified Conexibacter]MDO8189291.1 PKD domain-containing protein [Conexibacter sp. CPCC 205706]MDO8201747.1 PKD domain-containing protein [Conexibacter sp. CPCC 205762]MDR9372363.1 PKD domain-containing protein [Conexibacter sp. JD483]
MRLIPSAVLATALISLLPTAAAEAKDYCVAKPRCTGPSVPAAQLQASLTEAQSNGTADRFFLGDAIFAAGPYVYNSAEPVEIAGVSGTTLQSRVDDRTVLSVFGTAATVRGLKLELVRPAGAALQLVGASASDITVVQTLGNSAGVGVVLNDGASLTGSSIAMHEGTTPAVGTLSGAGSVSDSILSSAGAGAAVVQGGQLTVRRATIAASLGVQAFGGRAIVRDTLIDGRAGAPGGMTAGLAALAQRGNVADLDAARVTIVGGREDGNAAIGAYAVGADGGVSTLRIADSAISGTGVPLVRVAESGGSATVVADRVAHRDRVPGEPFEGGPGTTTETNRLPAPTGFADAARGDFHLTAGSPLVDAGDPAFAPDAVSDRDVAGAPRLADGDGDCTPRVDVGAYEYQRVLPHARATAASASAQTGAAVAFSAAGSCAADPAAPLTFVWQFDDGGSAAGAEVAHAFATAGAHTATVTAIDPAGKSAAASAQVTIAAPPAQPGPGPRTGRGADRTPPRLTALRAPRRIAAGRALPRLHARRGAPAFAFTLSERATVRLRFALRGRGGRYRTLRAGLTISAAKGANRLAFGGRLSRRARLAPGSYRVTLVATDAAGNRSKPATATFRLAR